VPKKKCGSEKADARGTRHAQHAEAIATDQTADKDEPELRMAVIDTLPLRQSAPSSTMVF